MHFEGGKGDILLFHGRSVEAKRALDSDYAGNHHRVGVDAGLSAPPHRSGLAAFPHTAPTLGDCWVIDEESHAGEWVQDLGSGNPTIDERSESGPGHPMLLTAATKRAASSE